MVQYSYEYISASIITHDRCSSPSSGHMRDCDVFDSHPICASTANSFVEYCGHTSRHLRSGAEWLRSRALAPHTCGLHVVACAACNAFWGVSRHSFCRLDSFARVHHRCVIGCTRCNHPTMGWDCSHAHLQRASQSLAHHWHGTHCCGVDWDCPRRPTTFSRVISITRQQLGTDRCHQWIRLLSDWTRSTASHPTFTLYLDELRQRCHPNAWLFLGALALGPQLIGHTSINYAMRHLSALLVTIAMLGEPVGSAILAFVLFAERIEMMQLVGLFGLLIGIAITAYGETREEHTS
jgi:hypothetical protein